MTEIARTRDVIIFDKGKAFTVNVDLTMAVNGWQGGQGVQYTPPPLDEPFVTFSDGYAAGFVLWGSDESSDEFTSMTRNQPTYKFVTIGAGSWVIATRTFEQFTYASRTGGGPLVPIVYNASDRLVFSLRGLWTKEDEWTLSGDPRAPNKFYLGYVIQTPIPARDNYMTIQVSI